MKTMDKVMKQCKAEGIDYATYQVRETWELVKLRRREELFKQIKKKGKGLKPLDFFRCHDRAEAEWVQRALYLVGIEASIMQVNGTWLKILAVDQDEG